MCCQVVNIYKYKGTDGIYCGRPGKGKKAKDAPFGNKFIVGVDGPQGECVKQHREWLRSNQPDAIEYRKLIDETIKPDSVLVCFCKSREVCHAGNIADYVEGGYSLDALNP